KADELIRVVEEASHRRRHRRRSRARERGAADEDRPPSLSPLRKRRTTESVKAGPTAGAASQQSLPAHDDAALATRAASIAPVSVGRPPSASSAELWASTPTRNEKASALWVSG